MTITLSLEPLLNWWLELGLMFQLIIGIPWYVLMIVITGKLLLCSGKSTRFSSERAEIVAMSIFWPITLILWLLYIVFCFIGGMFEYLIFGKRYVD